MEVILSGGIDLFCDLIVIFHKKFLPFLFFLQK
jgi:hypothetical protein